MHVRHFSWFSSFCLLNFVCSVWNYFLNFLVIFDIGVSSEIPHSDGHVGTFWRLSLDSAHWQCLRHSKLFLELYMRSCRALGCWWQLKALCLRFIYCLTPLHRLFSWQLHPESCPGGQNHLMMGSRTLSWQCSFGFCRSDLLPSRIAPRQLLPPAASTARLDLSILVLLQHWHAEQRPTPYSWCDCSSNCWIHFVNRHSWLYAHPEGQHWPTTRVLALCYCVLPFSHQTVKSSKSWVGCRAPLWCLSMFASLGVWCCVQVN